MQDFRKTRPWQRGVSEEDKYFYTAIKYFPAAAAPPARAAAAPARCAGHTAGAAGGGGEGAQENQESQLLRSEVREYSTHEI